MRRPLSLNNADAVSTRVPSVSAATGPKFYMVESAAFFVCFQFLVSTSTVPGSVMTGLKDWLLVSSEVFF